ncbi:MAG: HAD-IA family hydrolase [Oceanicoccus sp.]
MNLSVLLLSNDIGRWSTKLRSSFNIRQYFQGAIVSGDIRSRKPDATIYHILIARSGFWPGETLFFDDRQENILAANDLGISSRLFETAKGFAS